MSYFQATEFNPAKFDTMVGPSTGESVLDGVVAGIAAPLEAQVGRQERGRDREGEREMAHKIRASFLAQGFSPQEADAAAILFVKKGAEAMRQAVIDPSKAAMTAKKELGLIAAQDISNTQNAQYGPQDRQQKLDMGTSDLETAGVNRDVAKATSARADRTVDLTETRDAYLAGIGEREMRLKELAAYDINNNFKIDPEEEDKLFRKFSEDVRKENEKDMADAAGADPGGFDGAKPRKLTDDEVRSKAWDKVDDYKKRLEGDRDFLLNKRTKTQGGPETGASTEEKKVADTILSVLGGNKPPVDTVASLIKQHYPKYDVKNVLKLAGYGDATYV